MHIEAQSNNNIPLHTAVTQRIERTPSSTSYYS